MIHELKKPAMIPVAQPSLHLPRAYWARLEFELQAAMSSAAAVRQAVQSKAVQP